MKRAIRAIEIEEYYAKHPVPEREFPKLNSLIIGVDINREIRRVQLTRRLHQRLDEGSGRGAGVRLEESEGASCRGRLPRRGRVYA